MNALIQRWATPLKQSVQRFLYLQRGASHIQQEVIKAETEVTTACQA